MELLPLVLLKQDDPKSHPSLVSSGSRSPFPALVGIRHTLQEQAIIHAHTPQACKPHVPGSSKTSLNHLVPTT